ncbi:MAG: hypothetical protein U0270_20815 [Labilithrix sp.]
MRTLGLVVGALGLVSAIACGAPAEDASDTSTEAASVKVSGVSKADRKQYLASAKIWDADDFAKLPRKDLLTGPGGKGSFQATRNPDGSATFPSITCKFVEPTKANELGGKSPKFQCGACEDGCNVDKTLKVKFGKDADANGEVYAEVMATRLLWALGYKVDDVYPVRVTCKDCPEDPWAAYQGFAPGAAAKGGPRAERVYTAALIERKNDSPKIEEQGWPADKDGQGWAFDEVERVRAEAPNASGASSTEWNALKLLAAFIKHSDNKAANQRLVCDEGAVTPDGKCTAPYLMIQDMGATFGGGGQIFGSVLSASKAKLGKWEDTKVWFDRSTCHASLFSAWYTDVYVTEQSRVWLLDLLSKLTDPQLRDIFVASRVTERGETLEENGQRRAVTVDDWLAAFKGKLRELAKPCGR